MAYCPRCGNEIDTMDIACKHCYYNFPPVTDLEAPLDGGSMPPPLAYTPFADFCLGIAIVAAIIGLIIILFAAVNSLTNDFMAFLICVLSFILTFANLIVLLRVLDLKQPSK